MSLGVLSEKNTPTSLLIINIGDIAKNTRNPNARKKGFEDLKAAFEKVLGAEGATLVGARCEITEMKKSSELVIIFADGSKFVKITADWSGVKIVQNGETKDLQNFEPKHREEFGALITALAELNGVKVEFSGMERL